MQNGVHWLNINRDNLLGFALEMNDRILSLKPLKNPFLSKFHNDEWVWLTWTIMFAGSHRWPFARGSKNRVRDANWSRLTQIFVLLIWTKVICFYNWKKNTGKFHDLISMNKRVTPKWTYKQVNNIIKTQRICRFSYIWPWDWLHL